MRKPIYTTRFITGVQYKGRFSWYVLDEQDLVTEQTLLQVDEVNTYFQQIAPYRTSAQSLFSLLYHKKYKKTVLSMYPAFFMDFDNRCMYCQLPNKETNLTWIPLGWEGMFESFEYKVPIPARYWMKGTHDMRESLTSVKA